MHRDDDRLRSALERLISPLGADDALDRVRRGRRRAVVRRNVARIGVVGAVLSLSAASVVLLDRALGPDNENSLGGTPAAGGRIAFAARDGEDFGIYTVNLDGSGLRHLAPNPSQDGDPAWSPDGTQIAFTSFRSGNGDIYVMDGDGANVRRITESDGPESEPTWSPDGSWIAYVAAPENAALRIRAVRPDGSETVDLVQAVEYTSTVYGMDWSPHGRSLALAVMPAHPTPAQEMRGASLVVTELDSGSFKELYYRGPLGGPSWSPDGSRILFITGEGVRLIDAMGGEAPTVTRRLTGTPDADWSPDGSQFVVSSYYGNSEGTGGRGLYLFSSTGEDLGVIRVGDLYPGETSWQPTSETGIAITCDGTSISPETQTVRPARDGVHLTASNATDDRLQIRLAGGGTGVDPGTHEVTPPEGGSAWRLAPGTYSISCGRVAFGDETGPPSATVHVVDPEGLWVPATIGCSNRRGFSQPSHAFGTKGDPVDQAREYLDRAPAAPDMRLERAEYPESSIVTIRGVSGDRVVARFVFIPDRDDAWLFEEALYCV